MPNVTPITPSEVASKKQQQFPDEVIEAFNHLIAKHYSGKSATVYQDDAAELIASKMSIERHEVFANKYLDVEMVFAASGWKVEYDKPGWNESCRASFTFTRKDAANG